MTTTNHVYYIGLVKQAKGADLTENDKVLFNGEYRSISELKREGDKVRLSFNFLRKKDQWDMELTANQKVYILGAYRLTGLKGE